MPFTIDNPPDRIKGLPKSAQRIWVSTFNSIFADNGGNEASAIRISWAAVKNAGYKKVNDRWIKVKEAENMPKPKETWKNLFESLAWEEIERKLSVALDRRFGFLPDMPRTFDVFVMRKRTFADKVVYKVVKDGDVNFFQMNYELDDENNIVFTSEPEQVTFTEEPVKSQPITESIAIGQFLYEAKDKSEGRPGSVWRVILIKAGTSKNSNHYPKRVLQESLALFENVNALARSDQEHVNDQAKSVKNVVGFFQQVKFEEGKVTADFHILPAAEWLRENVLNAWQKGKKDLIGFSIVAEGTGRLENRHGKTIRMVESITKVNSVDVVVDPAAGGKFLKLVASASGTNQTIEEERETMDKLLKLLEAIDPETFKGIDKDKVTEDEIVALITEAKSKEKDEEKVKELEAKLTEAQKELKDKADADKKAKEDEELKLSEAKAKEEAEKKKAEADKEKSELEKLRESQKEESEKLKVLTDGLEKDRCGLKLTEALNKSNLPTPVQDNIRAQFTDRIFETKELEKVIEGQREVFSKLTESGNVSGIDFVRAEVGDSGRDKVMKGFDGFFDDEDIDGVPRFDSFREAYIMITGDKNLTGDLRQSPNLHRFTEALTTASWAQILGDSITRRMLKEYRMPGLDHWKLITSDITNIKDFRTNRRMRLGGYGELPTVTENGSYTALSSPTDEEATYAISKKGGTETITMEMIADDDVGSIRRIPVKLARAAKQTLMRAVFDPIRDNDAVTYDSKALFHADHFNLATTALSATALNAGKVAMRSQAAFDNSIEILGLTPKWILVPEELEDTAFRLTASGTLIDATNNAGTEPNIHATYGLKPIVIPYWTDGTDWALVADPKDVPTVEVGFFNGRREPELFIADRQESGAAMFTNDQIKYKIRFIFGVAFLDHRGFYKGVVAGT